MNKETGKKYFIYGLAGALMFVLLLLCYQSDFVLAENTWQTDSEALVIGRMYQMQHGIDNPGGAMGVFAGDVSTGLMFLEDLPVENGQYEPYLHQVGLQGTVAAVINRVLCMLRLAPQQRLNVLSMGNLLCFFLVLGAICLWIWRELGALPAALCALTLFSPWVTRSAQNLYWVMWLFLLPVAVSAWLCRFFEERRMPWQAALAMGLCLLARFLCGFEFVSTVLIAMEIPVVYYAAKHWSDRKKWLRPAFMFGVAGIAAFVLALAAWFGQTVVAYGGDVGAAVNEMLIPIVARTGVGVNALGTAQDIQDILALPLGEVLRTYWQIDYVFGPFSMRGLTMLYALLSAATIAACIGRKKTEALRTNITMLCTVCVSFLAPLSWFVLARGHAGGHFHVDYILWLMPVLPLLLAHVGYCAQSLCDCLPEHVETERSTG